MTYGITKGMKDISKVMSDLDELARKWQQEDAHLRTKLEGGKVRAQTLRFEKPLLLTGAHQTKSQGAGHPEPSQPC